MLALITGGSSGIGKDIAIQLAKLSYDLVLVARDLKNLEQVREEIKKENSKVTVQIYAFDISKSENCFKIYEKVKDVDILVNNAGFGLFGEFSKTDLETEINMINTNVTALHTLTKLYLKDMIKKDSGYILNVASIAGFMPGALMATYYATKNYVVSLTRAINKELKKKKSHVSVSLLCPGPVDTNFNNVANVRFRIPGHTSEYVAKYAIKKMKRKKLIITPGIMISIARLFAEVIPTFIIEEVCYYMQRKKDNK